MAQATLSWPSANSPCVRAKNRLDFVPALARAGSLRRWVLLYPKPSPRGEGAPVRTLGRMRGRPCTQPFLVEKRGAPGCRPNGSFLLPRWATRSPPHQSPSVTASPQGEASGLCSPTRKSVPNQGTQMGTETAPPPEQCATTAKTSEWERAGPKKGGAGGIPPRLFASGLSLRESLDPRPGPGGNPPRRCQPAPVQTRTTYQGQPGAAYPLGGCLRSHLGAQRPGGPADSGGGARLSLEKVGGKNTRGKPLDPVFYSRSFPLADFWVGYL